MGWRFPLSLSCIISAAYLAMSFTARADDQVLTGADPNYILELAKSYGAAAMDHDADGTPYIMARARGMRYTIYFSSCENGTNCRSIQLISDNIYPFSADRANEWNKNNRWITAYEDNGSNFRMDIDFRGITKDHVINQFETWSAYIPTIKEFLTTEE